MEDFHVQSASHNERKLNAVEVVQKIVDIATKDFTVRKDCEIWIDDGSIGKQYKLDISDVVLDADGNICIIANHRS